MNGSTLNGLPIVKVKVFVLHPSGCEKSKSHTKKSISKHLKSASRPKVIQVVVFICAVSNIRFTTKKK